MWKTSVYCSKWNSSFSVNLKNKSAFLGCLVQKRSRNPIVYYIIVFIIESVINFIRNHHLLLTFSVFLILFSFLLIFLFIVLSSWMWSVQAKLIFTLWLLKFEFFSFEVYIKIFISFNWLIYYCFPIAFLKSLPII